MFPDDQPAVRPAARQGPAWQSFVAGVWSVARACGTVQAYLLAGRSVVVQILERRRRGGHEASGEPNRLMSVTSLPSSLYRISSTIPWQISRPNPPARRPSFSRTSRWVNGSSGIAAWGRLRAIEARALVADDDLEVIVVDPVGDLDQAVRLVLVAPLDGVVSHLHDGLAELHDLLARERGRLADDASGSRSGP